jgi:hypothetical protein
MIRFFEHSQFVLLICITIGIWYFINPIMKQSYQNCIEGKLMHLKVSQIKLMIIPNYVAC